MAAPEGFGLSSAHPQTAMKTPAMAKVCKACFGMLRLIPFAESICSRYIKEWPNKHGKSN
jgi:hypothetical protein